MIKIMFNQNKIKELEAELQYQGEIIDLLLEKLNCDIDVCDCCSDLILVEYDKPHKRENA